MKTASPLLAATLAAAASILASGPARAEEVPTVELAITGKAFTPAEIHVPAGKPFVIKMKNNNAAPVELESKDLKIEKVAAGNSEIVVKVKAMAAGKYLFVDEFQEDEAKGFIIVE